MTFTTTLKLQSAQPMDSPAHYRKLVDLVRQGKPDLIWTGEDLIEDLQAEPKHLHRALSADLSSTDLMEQSVSIHFSRQETSCLENGDGYPDEIMYCSPSGVVFLPLEETQIKENDALMAFLLVTVCANGMADHLSADFDNEMIICWDGEPFFQYRPCVTSAGIACPVEMVYAVRNQFAQQREELENFERQRATRAAALFDLYGMNPVSMHTGKESGRFYQMLCKDPEWLRAESQAHELSKEMWTAGFDVASLDVMNPLMLSGWMDGLIFALEHAMDDCEGFGKAFTQLLAGEMDAAKSTADQYLENDSFAPSNTVSMEWLYLRWLILQAKGGYTPAQFDVHGYHVLDEMNAGFDPSSLEGESLRMKMLHSVLRTLCSMGSSAYGSLLELILLPYINMWPDVQAESLDNLLMYFCGVFDIPDPDDPEYDILPEGMTSALMREISVHLVEKLEGVDDLSTIEPFLLYGALSGAFSFVPSSCYDSLVALTNRVFTDLLDENRLEHALSTTELSTLCALIDKLIRPDLIGIDTPRPVHHTIMIWLEEYAGRHGMYSPLLLRAFMVFYSILEMNTAPVDELVRWFIAVDEGVHQNPNVFESLGLKAEQSLLDQISLAGTVSWEHDPYIRFFNLLRMLAVCIDPEEFGEFDAAISDSLVTAANCDASSVAAPAYERMMAYLEDESGEASGLVPEVWEETRQREKVRVQLYTAKGLMAEAPSEAIELIVSIIEQLPELVSDSIEHLRFDTDCWISLGRLLFLCESGPLACHALEQAASGLAQARELYPDDPSFDALLTEELTLMTGVKRVMREPEASAVAAREQLQNLTDPLETPGAFAIFIDSNLSIFSASSAKKRVSLGKRMLQILHKVPSSYLQIPSIASQAARLIHMACLSARDLGDDETILSFSNQLLDLFKDTPESNGAMIRTDAIERKMTALMRLERYEQAFETSQEVMQDLFEGKGKKQDDNFFMKYMADDFVLLHMAMTIMGMSGQELGAPDETIHKLNESIFHKFPWKSWTSAMSDDQYGAISFLFEHPDADWASLEAACFEPGNSSNWKEDFLELTLLVHQIQELSSVRDLRHFASQILRAQSLCQSLELKRNVSLEKLKLSLQIFAGCADEDDLPEYILGDSGKLLDFLESHPAFSMDDAYFRYLHFFLSYQAMVAALDVGDNIFFTQQLELLDREWAKCEDRSDSTLVCRSGLIFLKARYVLQRLIPIRQLSRSQEQLEECLAIFKDIDGFPANYDLIILDIMLYFMSEEVTSKGRVSSNLRAFIRKFRAQLHDFLIKDHVRFEVID
ncbi:hypothetical protein [Allobaculum mucilyticum]|uniref:hypothetical protein n=1 Tax=Allobaculum mucilyticum TaxID=2834459 RepID=UPI001E4D3E2C|nr:hypothetical protein [Allobaculum mucilyticum]UNT97280.1 hypothetical protein KWG62_05960 [Allobaculum mucilyticum]